MSAYWSMGQPHYWWGRYVSSPVRRGMRKQFKGKIRNELELATLMTGHALVGLPHLALGGLKYSAMARIGQNIEAAKHTVWSYNMAQAERRAIASGLVGKGSPARNKMLRNIVRSPSKGAAVKAARFARIAGRVHPIGMAAMVALDVYELATQGSFWGWQIF